jgi:hypothetical protein
MFAPDSIPSGDDTLTRSDTEVWLNRVAEHITFAANCLYDTRLVGSVSQFLAQPGDVHVDGPR